MGLYYIGPADGNNYEDVEALLNAAKNAGESVLVHLKTKKGKGYAPAESDPNKYHGLRANSLNNTASSDFSSEFGTYNNYQDSIGYEVYDPLEYGDGFNIGSPLSIYQPNVEKMGNFLLSKLDFSQAKDEKWLKQMPVTKISVTGI